MSIANLGRAERYEELFALLRESGYTDAFLCRRFGLSRAEDYALDRGRRPSLPALESAADVLVTLFLAGESVPVETAAGLLGAAGLQLLRDMGTLEETAAPEPCAAAIALYPVGDLYIGSDRWNRPGDAPFQAPDDLVYPAFIPNTRLFLRHLPECRGGLFLDLCSGTGAGALVAAAQGARLATAGDIAERSTRFADFNRRLNGLANVDPVTSDLYAGLEGRRFDVIAAHPPYVPTLKPSWIFYSGGQDGEGITQRIVAGLPQHLNEGGVFLALTMGSDRVEGAFEQRIRSWLGPRNREFDVALIVRREHDPVEAAVRANRGRAGTEGDLEAWQKLFAGLGTRALVYGFVVIQRLTGARAPFTVRRQASPHTPWTPWEWVMRWEAARAGDGLARLVLGSRLHASAASEFRVTHRLGEGGWNPASYRLLTDEPFSMECEAEPWMAHLLSLCDGNSTGAEVLAILRQNGVLPGATADEEFVSAAASLASGGFLEVEGFRLPRAAE